MTTVYVVTTGSYSDYKIRGVYSDRRKARIVAKAHEGRVEPFDLDGDYEAFRDGLVSWYVKFEEGYEPRVYRDDTIDRARHLEVYEGMDSFFRDGAFVHPTVLRVTVFARDEAHALKIAQDKRAEYLAKEAGV